MTPVARAFSDPTKNLIVGVCGAQMGKTETQFNIMGHRLDDGPQVPMLYIAPTAKAAGSIADDRFRKMLLSTATLHAKLEKGQRDRKMEKFIAGVRVGFGWAGSPTELASHPAGLVLVDERSRMASDVSGEGDPVYLAMARTKNFPGRKVGVFSTPTIEGICPTWALFLEGTKMRWAWLCPHCGAWFVPELRLLKWPRGCTPTEAKLEAYVECPACEGHVTDTHKPALNRTGRYIPHELQGETLVAREEPIPSPTASFQISGLASPWQSFGDIAQMMVSAYRSREPERIQAATNTYGGEVWKASGEAPSWTVVQKLQLAYEPRTIPHGVQFLTAGVDVQKEKLYYVVRGWGHNAESWLLDYGQLFGSTDYDEVYLSLGNLLRRPIGAYSVRRALVDSGYRPGDKRARPENQIYLFARREAATVAPSKGHDTQDRPLKTNKIDVNLLGGTVKGGLTLWHVDTNYFKTWLYGRLEWPEGEPGGWHVHSQVDEDYCRQVVSEEVLIRSSGRRQWLVKYDNHYLDCEVLAAAAAHSLNVHTLKPIEQVVESEAVRARSVTLEGNTRKVSNQFRRHGL